MRISTLALVMAGGVGSRLYPLTRDRVKPAVPFGGIYRLIDFVLSNCLNSNIRRICVLTQYKSLSLERHIRYGWSFLPHTLEEYIQLLPPQQRVDNSWYQGTADAVFQNLYTVEQAHPDVVLLLSGDHIYKMNYNHMIKAHVENQAAVTVATVSVPLEQACGFGVVELDKRGCILKFHEKPERPAPIPGRPDHVCVSMGIYVFNTALLKKALQEDHESRHSSHDFGKDILPALFKKERVFSYGFVDENRKKELYWRDVGSIDAYWEASMDLVAVDPIFNLYDRAWPINTYTKPAPPAKFVFADIRSSDHAGRVGYALDSLISSGVILAGGQVIRSILSPHVRVDEEARVEESVLFHGVKVGAGSRLYRTIVDKDVIIPPGTVIGFNHQRDAEHFTVSPGGIAVVPRRMKLAKRKKGQRTAGSRH